MLELPRTHSMPLSTLAAERGAYETQEYPFVISLDYIELYY